MKSRREFVIKSGAAGAAMLVPGWMSASTLFKEEISRLIILHTNDVHSRIEPFPMDGSRNAGLGGAAARALIHLSSPRLGTPSRSRSRADRSTRHAASCGRSSTDVSRHVPKPGRSRAVTDGPGSSPRTTGWASPDGRPPESTGAQLESVRSAVHLRVAGHR